MSRGAGLILREWIFLAIQNSHTIESLRPNKNWTKNYSFTQSTPNMTLEKGRNQIHGILFLQKHKNNKNNPIDIRDSFKNYKQEEPTLISGVSSTTTLIDCVILLIDLML
jgi:hypothetical protein